MNNEYPLATRRAIVDTSKLHALNRAMPAAPAETYFHCTYAKNLPGIAKRGLVPSPAPGLLRAVAKNHRGVYLTEPGGILFWFGRLEAWAFHDSDDAYEEGLVPVVLKVNTSCRLIEDELGTEHARARAAVCPRPIPPGAIRVWDGADWIPVRDYELIDLRQACTWDDEDRFDGFKYSNQNPLNPLNDRVLPARSNPGAPISRAKLPRGWSIRHVEIAADDPDLFEVSHRRAVVHVARSRPAAVRWIREHSRRVRRRAR